MTVIVKRFESANPADVSGLRQALSSIDKNNIGRVAVIGKTEGPATTNDFSRVLFLQNINAVLTEHGIDLDTQSRVIISMGCEGVITPGGFLIVETRETSPAGIEGLALGMARSEPLKASEMITVDHARIAADVVRTAIENAGLTPDQVGLVLMKTPILTAEEAIDLPPVQRRRANMSGLARGTAALGIASALGEINQEQIIDEAIIGHPELYSTKAMVFSGNETRSCEAIVLGNRDSASLSVRSGIVTDILDIDGLARVLTLDAERPIDAARALASEGKVVAAFFKAGVAPDGRVRGNRTTVFSSDLDPDKHMRAAASGVIGALLGDTRIFVSGGAEHQAPAGGGVFTAIVANT